MEHEKQIYQKSTNIYARWAEAYSKWEKNEVKCYVCTV